MDGGLDAQTIRLEGRFGSRAVGGRGVIVNCAGPEGAGNRIEQACSRQLSSVRARFPRCGVAVLACELAGLPWPAFNLSKLKLHAAGKGNAGKPENPAAATARWGVDRK
jgi:hypothetical protein